MKCCFYKNKLIASFLIVAFSLFFTSVQAKRPLRRSEQPPAVKEYVVMSAGKNSVADRLGVLYDKLKLFSNHPKNLKDLQEETDKLEDSLREKIAKMKDAQYVISRVRMETADLRNDIPVQEDNAQAKKVFDEIVEFWNSAEGEIEKISKLSEEFEGVAKQVNDKIDEIGKALKDGGDEITKIKDELDKIAAMEEELAGADEREILKDIDQFAGHVKRKASLKQAVTKASESKELESQEVTRLVFSDSDGPKEAKADEKKELSPSVISFAQSVQVVFRLVSRFFYVAYSGLKDLFVRLFVIDTAKDQPSEKPEAKADEKKEKLEGPEKYKQAAVNSLSMLGRGVVGIAKNSYSYVTELYFKVMAEKPEAKPDEGDEPAKADAKEKQPKVEKKPKPVAPAKPAAPKKASEPIKPVKKAKPEKKNEQEKSSEKKVKAPKFSVAKS